MPQRATGGRTGHVSTWAIVALVWLAPLVRQNEARGRFSHRRHGRISDAIAADKHEFPFMVSIQERQPDGSLKHICAGTILNRHYIATAAQCVAWAQGDLMVKLGCTKLSECDRPAISVKGVITHRDYDPHYFQNDIALLMIREKIQYGKEIGLIDLARHEHCRFVFHQVVGWGWMDRPLEDTSDALLKASLMLAGLEQCQKHNPEVDETFICTEPVGKGTCLGDIGSPLIRTCVTAFEAMHTLVGMVTFHRDYICNHRRGAFYTNVTNLLPWIDQQMISLWSD